MKLYGRVPNVLMYVGFAFLYLPIIMLILYSFNSSKIVTVWAGFSTIWYYELWGDKELIKAFITSLKIASVSATLSTLFGLLAGISLSRFPKFKGRTLLSGMLSAPFVVPEVVTGFSLLMFFIAISELFDASSSRGMGTVIIAHTTIGIAYVALIVQSKLTTFDHSLEDAALDLGCRPFKVFLVITLPLIMPAIIGGWLMAFTISLDDLVISSFTSGPGAVTLPMLIYSRVRLGVSPAINALTTIFVVFVTIAALITSNLILKKKN